MIVSLSWMAARAAVAIRVKFLDETAVHAVFAFKRVRCNHTHLDVITLGLQIIDELRRPWAVAQRGIEDEVFTSEFAHSRCLRSI